ncbi:MAG: hypothetical protein IPO60_14340 [Flavobacteriales bacterium]|nr:hypothetical protein [Flavobacteriales bacterium]
MIHLQEGRAADVRERVAAADAAVQGMLGVQGDAAILDALPDERAVPRVPGSIGRRAGHRVEELAIVEEVRQPVVEVVKCRGSRGLESLTLLRHQLHLLLPGGIERVLDAGRQ